MITAILPSGVGRNLVKSNRRETPLLIHLCIPALILWGVGTTTVSAARCRCCFLSPPPSPFWDTRAAGFRKKLTRPVSEDNGYPTGYVYIQTRSVEVVEDGGGHVTDTRPE